MASPQTIQGTGVTDTYIASAAATTNYSTATTILVNHPTAAHNFGLLEFDFTGASIPAGSEITQANLSLYCSAHGAAATSKAVEVQHIVRNDMNISQATYNIFKTSNNWGTSGAANATSDHTTTNAVSITTSASSFSGTWLTWDIHHQLQHALDSESGVWRGRVENKGTAGTGNTITFYSTDYNTDTSLRPKLVITWTDPVEPSVTTVQVGGIQSTTAIGFGNVTSAGTPATVSDRGICWSTSASPTIADSHTHSGTGTGTFTAAISGLTAETHYHARAFAVNAHDTGYGSDVEFTTGATGTLRPDGDGSLTEFANQEPATGNHWDKVDEVSYDSSTTFVQGDSNGVNTDLFATSHSIPAEATITSVNVYAWLATNGDEFGGGCDGKIGFKDTTGTYWSSTITLSASEYGSPQLWTEHSTGARTTRYNGTAWTMADIDALEIGVQTVNSSYWGLYCTQIYAVVVWSVAGGPAGVKNIMGQAWADVKMLEGQPAADIKKVMGE